MTLPLFNAAREVLFIASGAEKAAIVRQVLRDRDVSPPFPAQMIEPVDGNVAWMLDRAAARDLGEAS